MKRLISFFLSLFIVCSIYAEGIASGSVYRISTRHTGNRTLMIENSNLDNNAQATLWAETGTNSQRWRITEAEAGAYYIDNMYTGKRLYRQASSSIVQSDLNTTNSYKWILTPIEEAGYENCYYISNKNNENLVLQLSSVADEDAVKVSLANKNSDKVDRQIWKIEKVDELPNYLTPAVRDTMMRAWKNRYFDWLKTSGGFWGEAELMEIILDAYETTGQEEYKTMFEEAYKNFINKHGKSWMSNDFNDDIAWAVLMSIRAYYMFGNSIPGINYLSIARDNFDKMYERARYKVDDLYYLLRWKEGQGGTTSCINGPAEVAACYLAMTYSTEEKQKEYYEKAKELYLNQRIHMYVPTTGQVYDSFDNGWASPYNQGTYLGAAVMLYNHYGDEMFKKDAELIMSYSIKHLCNHNNILTSCGTEDGDLANFKAILLRYVRRFYADMGNLEAGEWLQKNALQAYNNRNPAGISRVSWEIKTGEKYVYKNDAGETKEKDWNSYAAFAAVSAAVNAPMDLNTIYKDAFSTIEAGSFNYISKVYSQNNLEGEKMELVDIQKGAYLGYNLVDFKNRLATGIELTVANDDKVRTVEIRQGSSKGKLLGTVTVPGFNGTYTTVQAVLDIPVDGTQNIYLVFQGDQNGLMFKSFTFTGDANNAMYSDVTEPEYGIISSSNANDNDLSSLIDDKLGSVYTTSVVKNSNVKIVYSSQIPAHITAYGVAAAKISEAPNSWKLEASNDSANWVALDTKTSQTFTTDYELKKLDLSPAPTEAYRFYCLTINNDDETAKDYAVAEWQLYGSALAANDITSDGGTLTAQYAGKGTNENYTKLTDNAIDTKYLVENQTELWLQYQANARYMLTGYSISSANDDATRDPKSWVLYGSANGTDWDEIDTQENQVFQYRQSTQMYQCAPEKNYSYFKLQVTANNGATHTQMSEWQLFGTVYLDSYSHDFTKSGGMLSSSASENGADAALTALTDNDAETYYSIPGTLPVWIQYESTVPLQLQGYSITSNNTDSKYDPKSWKLQGSANGTTWVDIDSQTAQAFELRSLKKNYEKSNSALYRYFRLQITAANSSEIRIAEWQLYGVYLNSYDATIGKNSVMSAQWNGNYVLNDDKTVKHDERFIKLIDKSKTGKYCVDGRKSFWVVFKSERPLALNAYSLMSANDNAGRDPKSWTLYASNDSVKWDVLDIRDEQIFSYRNTTQYYLVPENIEKKSYQYFKLDVKENGGDKTIQLAELQFFGTYNEYEEDITENGGILTSSHQATDGTTLNALIDNDETSKYYLNITNAQFGDGIWFKYQSAEEVFLTSYTLTSSSEQPDNDPKSWKLQGSNDDAEWVDIDVVEDYLFDNRCERKEFNVSTGGVAYKYFRLYITARKGTVRGFQLAEWELFTSPGAGVSDVAGKNSLVFFPNPAVDYIVVNVPVESVLNIYNMNSGLVYTQKVQQGSFKVDMQNYPQGAYIIQLKSDEFTKTDMLIKK